jgi:hypothetical protein
MKREWKTWRDTFDWLAQLTTHIPNRGEQMVRYYGYYSNKPGGIRRKNRENRARPRGL